MDELVEAFVARKPSGLEQAYALWSRLLFSVARHAIADSGQAEDCVHDALVRVWRSPNRFTGNREMLKAYLITCVRNESLGMIRREGRRDARELKTARLAPVTSVDPPVVDPVETQRLQAALGQASRGTADGAYARVLWKQDARRDLTGVGRSTRHDQKSNLDGDA